MIGELLKKVGILPGRKAQGTATARVLRGLMSRFTVRGLVRVDREAFRERIQAFLDTTDHEGEGFRDPFKQRDLSVRFHWGHNHDFGDFSLKGLMGNRHIKQLSRFIDEFQAIPPELGGKCVLEVGSWTGGMSLLLSAMGAHVTAIEEVKKYSECLAYLKFAFDIPNLDPRNMSLYECTTPEFQDRFDFVFLTGVLYHVSDPLLALRIAFNALKDGGLCLIETAAFPSPERVLSYEGPTVFGPGRREDLSRTGWNWFIPSPESLRQMLTDVGYRDIRLGPIRDNRAYGAERLYATAKRVSHIDMLRSGLSVRKIR